MEVPGLTVFLFLLSTHIIGLNGIQQITNPRIIEHPENQYVAKNEPATLNCKAEGDPPPIISWYRDGQLVITANENPISHRMLLPSGQLFFLRIITSKSNKQDVGVYYCNATNPETRVSVISRNASLEIAVIGSEFREQPRNVDVANGMDAVFDCRPPKGEPEPRVRWRKDGEQLKSSDRVTFTESGSLRIRDVRKDDAGSYVCVAYNIGAERDSQPARLAVREKPRIVEGPKDVLVQENSDVSFYCRATGDPEPTIIWKKVEDQMPQGRIRILEDRSLKIERTRQSDEGIYVCRAENSVGFQEAEAKLTVHSQPSFLVTPRDKSAGIGRRVIFRCEVTGNPMPAVFWNKEASQTLMFPNQDHGRMSVSDDGTLTIENVQKSDAGEYICKGLSIAGSAYAKARLEVKEVDPRPPPIIHQGPQNQTLPINSVAVLQCSASGDPPPTVKWLRNGRPLPLRDPRFTLLDSGSLQISDLRKTDTGLYTCKAVSETGETAWSSGLVVEAPSNPTVIFHRTPEPSTFPGPPTKPAISDVTEVSVRLTWRNNANHGASPVFAYTVEYFSHETGEGWIVASDSVYEQTFTVRGLRQDTAYMFLVRAQNSHGLSLPSHVTAPIRTKGIGPTQSRPTVQTFDLNVVAEKLSGQIVTVAPPEVLGSTAVKLAWEVRRSQKYLEGFHIRYRAIPELDEHQGRSAGGSHTDFVVETVSSLTTTMYTLHNLEKNTWYEINVQPFYLTIVGQESNTVRVRTLEDVPSAMPQNIRARMVDNNTLYMTWEAPPRQHCNGPLRGYKIYIYGNESKFDREIQINSSLEALYVHHMVKDMTYKIQMSAYNRMGEGVRSEPIIMGPLTSTAKQNIAKEPWFIATLIVTIGGTLWLVLCVFSVWLYRKRKSGKKMSKAGTPSKYGADCARNGGKLNALNAPSYSEKDKMDMQSKENLQSPSSMKTFYNKSLSIEPYATTDLMMSGDFQPIQQQQYMIQPRNGSTDSCIKQNISTSDSNNAPSADLNDEGQQYEQIDFANSPMSEYGPMENLGLYGHPMQQPTLFLPPPPEHPPPSDIGTPPDSPRQRNVNMFWENQHGPPPMYAGRNLHSDCEREMRQHFADRTGSLNPRLQSHSYRMAQRGGDGGENAKSQFGRQGPPSPKQRGDSQRVLHNSRGCSPLANAGDSDMGAGRGYRMVPGSDADLQRLYGASYNPVHGSARFAAGSQDPNQRMQSNFPNLINDCLNQRLPNPNSCPPYAGHSPESPVSEIGLPDTDMESDVDLTMSHGGQSPPVSDTEITLAVDPTVALWEVANEDSDANQSSLSDASSNEGFLAEADFASAVAKAAQLSGLTVIGSTVIDPNSGREREKVKKPAKLRQRARCTSPYSTDSNYSTVPHKPYPKSDRKRQLREQGSRHAGQDEKAVLPIGKPQPPVISAKPKLPTNGGALSLASKPSFSAPHEPAFQGIPTTTNSLSSGSETMSFSHPVTSENK